MKKKFLLICLISLLIIGFSFNYVTVKADSGWDTDYDFGGSDWGGSDYDYDYDSDWGNSGGGSYSGDGFFPAGLMVIIIIVVVIIVISKNGKTAFSNYIITIDSVKSRYNFVDENTIKEKIPEFNKEEFLTTAYINFLDIQNAWTNFDYDRLRSLLSDELFNTYQSQLKALKLKKQINMMEEFVQDFIDISSFEYVDGKATIKVVLLTSFYDYITNAKGDVLRGTKANKVNNAYELTFISSKAKKSKAKKCPNCNAPLEDKVTNKCPYCGTKIIHSSYDWVLSKKEVTTRYNK